MATEAQVWAEMEERGIRTQYDDPEYWGVNRDFEAVKNEMELETYESFKKALTACPLFSIQGDELTKTAHKLHDDFLAGDQEDLPYLDDNGFPVFTYKGFCITVESAVWTFEDDEEEFTHKDFLKGLIAVDRILEERE